MACLDTEIGSVHKGPTLHLASFVLDAGEEGISLQTAGLTCEWAGLIQIFIRCPIQIYLHCVQ